MANTARITQSVIASGVSQNGTAFITQSFILAAVGVGVSCGNPPAGSVGTPYSHLFPSGGGEPPLTFSIAAGALPGGLVLNASTGLVSGTPISAGTFAFTIQVNDSSGEVDSVACSITIGGSIVKPQTPGAGGRGSLCGRPKNQFDWCMFAEALKYSLIEFPPLCVIPEELRQRYPLPWGEDFGTNAIPEQAVPFSRIGYITTPPTAAGDVLITEERVPYGYDGLMMGFFTAYTGQGFEQGSGDIEWRVQLNQRYLENLGNIEFQLGSSVSPCPLTEGQILLSGQLMRLVVSVPNLSGNIQIGGSQVGGGLIGFYWPR